MKAMWCLILFWAPEQLPSRLKNWDDAISESNRKKNMSLWPAKDWKWLTPTGKSKGLKTVVSRPETVDGL